MADTGGHDQVGGYTPPIGHDQCGGIPPSLVVTSQGGIPPHTGHDRWGIVHTPMVMTSGVGRAGEVFNPGGLLQKAPTLDLGKHARLKEQRRGQD